MSKIYTGVIQKCGENGGKTMNIPQDKRTKGKRGKMFFSGRFGGPQPSMFNPASAALLPNGAKNRRFFFLASAAPGKSADFQRRTVLLPYSTA